MNQAVKESYTMGFQQHCAFFVTLRHPRREDFIVVALKSGFTSWLLTFPMQVCRSSQWTFCIHRSSLWLSHLWSCCSQQRQLPPYWIVVSWVAEWSVLVESCHISRCVFGVGWTAAQQFLRLWGSTQRCLWLHLHSSSIPPVPQPSDGPGGCHLSDFGDLLVRKWTQGIRIAWEHIAVLVYQWRESVMYHWKCLQAFPQI